MNYKFLVGMHLAFEGDISRVKRIYSDYYKLKKMHLNEPDRGYDELYDYFVKNMLDEAIIIDKIRVLSVPEMTVEDMSICNWWDYYSDEVIGFAPYETGYRYGLSDTGELITYSAINDIVLERKKNRHLYAKATLGGYSTDQLNEHYPVPLYFNDKLVYKPKTKVSHIMAIYNMFDDWEDSPKDWAENIVFYVDLLSNKACGLIKSKLVCGDKFDLCGLNGLDKLEDFYNLPVYENIPNSDLVDLSKIKSDDSDSSKNKPVEKASIEKASISKASKGGSKMSYKFLVGMHLAGSSSKIEKMFNMLNSAIDSANDPMEVYEYMLDNVANTDIYITKVRVLTVPEMKLEDISIADYEKSKLEIIGFEPVDIVSILPEGNALAIFSSAEQQREQAKHRREKEAENKKNGIRYARVNFCGYISSDVEELDIIPMYYKDKLVFPVNKNGGNTMTILNMYGEWEENVNIYLDIESREFATVRDTELLSGNLDKSLYGQDLFGDVYGFYRLVYCKKIDNSQLVASGTIEKKSKSTSVYNSGYCVVDLAENKEKEILLPFNAIKIKFRFDDFDIKDNVTVIFPPSFVDLDISSIMTDINKFKFIFSKIVDIKILAKAFNIEYKDDSTTLNSIKKKGVSIEFY